MKAFLLLVSFLLISCGSTTYVDRTKGIVFNTGSMAENAGMESINFTLADGTTIIHTKFDKNQMDLAKSYLMWKNAPAVLRGAGSLTEKVVKAAN